MGMGPMGMGTGATDKPLELPEHCLVRVIDVTVAPGKAYEYRMRVKMANPNLDRKDVANPRYAFGETLLSEWSTMPIRVRVEPELHYYAVDQKEIDRIGDPRNRYEGPYARTEIKPGMVMLQAHRWLTEAKLNTGTPLIVGEWSVAERFPVFKGEYVGRSERTKVPVWRYTREMFTIPTDPTLRPDPTGKKDGIQVDFGYGVKDGNQQPEAILVDFEQGSQTYVPGPGGDKPDGTKKTDSMGLQVLMVNPDGRLVLLEGAIDKEDEARKTRLKQVQDRILAVEKAARTPAGFGGTPMGPGGRN